MAELRIVAGEWRGRRIVVPAGGVRPTADRVREAWMSIVRPALDGARVVDLYAGSGALGLEAISRGAVHCDFVERDAGVLRTLLENITALGAGTRSAVHRADALQHLESVAPEGSESPWDVAFADPPYHEGIAVALAERWLRAPFAAIFGVEHEAGAILPVAGANAGAGADAGAGAGVRSDRRVYGDSAITIYRTGR